MIPLSDPLTKKYFEKLQKEVDKIYDIAQFARTKGYDHVQEVEIKQATNLAERTEAIIGPKGVAKRYFEILDKTNDRLKTIFEIFKEIVLGKLGNIPDEELRVAQAIRTALVLLTEGVVVAPIDGLPRIKLSKNNDGSKYVDLYFAGPIRAAGGTATVFPLILGDYAKHLLGLGKYTPTKTEVERYVEENKIYHQISSRQFKPTDDDVRYIVQNCPVCINGEGTEKQEVSINRDLPRIETNVVRGGACLVISEGIGLKSAKLLKFAKKLDLDWSWLKKFVKVKDNGSKREIVPVKKYLTGAAAGRPIFAYPSRFGGFRLRYGRTRTTGLMGKAIHPITMYLLNEFPAVGTQLKVERPGKAATITSCDEIEPPVVLTKDKSVIKLDSMEILEKNKENIDKILFLGDMLVPYGDFRKSGHPLVPAGFCEEWWYKLVEKKAETNEELKNSLPFDYKMVGPYKAIEISEKYQIPLHPNYIFYYNQMSKLDIEYVKNKLKNAKQKIENNKIVGLELEYDDKLATIFTNIILPFRKIVDKMIIGNIAYPLLKTFDVFADTSLSDSEDILQILSYLAGFEIKDKGGTFIGSRMGRPEAAKPRKMKGSPQTLFPISKLGGNVRNINKAVDVQSQDSRGLLGNTALSQINIGLFKCPKCGKETPYPYCFDCKERTEKIVFCNNCEKSFFEKDKLEKCPYCGGRLTSYKIGYFDLGKIYNNAIKRLNVTPPKMLKGVEGLISERKIAEPLEKGVLRAIHGLYVFKDGTIRSDLLDANLTHFRPKELGISIEKLKELGYTEDINGNKLENENQMLMLFVQDIIINDVVADYYINVTKFVDDLLVKFYGLKPFYNVKTRKDLIGHLVLGLAPHTSAGVIGRIIGFTKARVMFAHPYYNTAKRRNTDGDQDGMILLLDALLNFSLKYLAESRGSKMDAPLVMTVLINPTEIDDEAYEMELSSEYPLELYEASEKLADASIKGIKIVKNILNTEKQFSEMKFTHDTKQFDAGPKQSRYTLLKNMVQKIMLQINLQNKINAVDKKGALELVVNTHLFPDLMGNTRAFSRQKFRCSKCNAKFRRLPLQGYCPKCGNNNIILTISEGSVKKYLEIAKKMVYDNNLSTYTQERLKLLENEINSVFNEEEKHQRNIMDFF